MGQTDHDAIQEIKSRLDLVEVVRRYVALRPAGSRWVGPCPFHHETKPSFHVNQAEGLFYCFGCQASGDLFDFYGRINGLDFKESLEQLAAEAGVKIAPGRADPKSRERTRLKKAALEMHSLAQALFRRNLKAGAGAKAVRYLKQRKMSPEVIEAFGLGYSLDDWHALDGLLKSKGYGPEDAVTAGLLSKNQKGDIYDRFRGRLMFPILDLSDRVIAFGGRAIGDDDPKYINSSDSPIYKKGEHLYGLNIARRSLARDKRALLTEGYVDVISLHQFGFASACGVLGTALTEAQVRRLAGFCRAVDLVFDGDRAGMEAARRSAEMILAHGLNCRVVLLPEGEDVDSLLQGQGEDAFISCLDNAVDGLEYCLARVGREFSPKETLEWAVGFVAGLKEQSLGAYYLPRISAGLGLSESELALAVRRGSGSARADRATKGSSSTGAASRRDRELLKFAVGHRQHIETLMQKGLREVLSTDRARAFCDKLASCGDQDIMTRLDEGEKRFYAQCKMEHAEGEEGLDQKHFREICDFLDKKLYEQRKKALLRGLNEAQLKGDNEERDKLLREYRDFLGRADEQR